MNEFNKTIPQSILNIEEKKRSNLFNWRGQFSPQLIECILNSYCPREAVVLDPFAGSGRVLFEAAAMGLPALGYEINPSAWSFCKLFEFINFSSESREVAISELRKEIRTEFPIILFSEEYLSTEEVEQRIIRMGDTLSDRAKVLCNALVVLLDLYKNKMSNDLVQSKFYELVKLIRNLPYSEQWIKADLQDARCMPLENQIIDFVVTSPPYINVFNYHQNYRRSVEALGWDVLRVARSEIGSNRANRGNRFFTVVQYCIDMARVLQELSRVLKPAGRAVFIVGYESKVLGVPFYNADIIEEIARESGMFEIVLRQKRIFKNRFGQNIREDILNFEKKTGYGGSDLPEIVGKGVALKAIENASQVVAAKNKTLIDQALSRAGQIKGTPVFNSTSYREYQTREFVMMVNEDEKEYKRNI